MHWLSVRLSVAAGAALAIVGSLVSPSTAPVTENTVKAIVAQLYADVRPELHEPAGWAVLGHLVKLVDDGVARADGPITIDAHFSLR